jgi:ribonuclease III
VIVTSDMLRSLETKLGYFWSSQQKLVQAFIHTSWANEQVPKMEPNERLEFLGDSCLDLLSAEYLYVQHPQDREGALSQMRAQIVRTSALALRARRLGLGELLLVGKGADYLRDVESVLADTLEAVIGAAYLDGGLEAARQVAYAANILWEVK